MPEIKHNFTGGKMNKDLDERLVPNGQYRDAINVEVSTSESSNVGTVKNILGNKRIESLVGSGFKCVGSIADEKTNKLYWFISSYEKDIILEYDADNDVTSPVLVDLKSGTQKAVLKFFGNIITGINIIDNLLFWTDNQGEPKKINIDICKAGTPNIDTHTRLSFNNNSFRGIAVEYVWPAKMPDSDTVTNWGAFQENHAPEVNIEDRIKIGRYVSFERRRFVDMLGFEFAELIDDYGQIMDANNHPVDTSSSSNAPGNLNSTPNDGYRFEGRHYRNGKLLGTKLIEAFDNPNGSYFKYQQSESDSDFKVGDVIFAKNKWDNFNQVHVSTFIDIDEKHITVIKPKPLKAPTVKINYKEISQGANKIPNLFEEKFPRFSYRYKYRDGEYSAFAPFTQAVFNPQYTKDTTKSQDGSVLYNEDTSYDITEPRNKAMVNSIHSVDLMNFITEDTPEDVVEINILYKQENSPIIYSIGTVKHTDFEWHASLNYENKDLFSGGVTRYYGNFDNSVMSQKDWMPAAHGGYNSGKYKITTENIYAAIPANQLLRPWDNVPRKAKAQEVSGSRIIYGNYLQNYTVVSEPKISVDYSNRKQTVDSFDTKGLPSIKSQRNYQIGVIYCDEFGRETPVFTSDAGAINIPWVDTVGGKNASKNNQLIASIENDFPDWVNSVKFFVKENSGEYYNLVMQRAWTGKSTYEIDNSEGHLWLSFPSSDRNKLTEEDYIILKKKIGVGEEQIPFENKFKVIDIKNEPPDAIKYSLIPLGSVNNDTGDSFTTDNANATTYDMLFPAENQRPDKQQDTIVFSADRWTSDPDNPNGSYRADLVNSNNGESESAELKKLYISWARIDSNGVVTSSSKYKVIGGRKDTDNYVLKLNRDIKEIDADIAHVNGKSTDEPDEDHLHQDLVFYVECRELKEDENFSGQFFVKISKNYITNIIETGNEITNLDKFQVKNKYGVWYWQDDVDGSTQTNSSNPHVYANDAPYGVTNYFGFSQTKTTDNDIQDGAWHDDTNSTSGTARLSDWFKIWELVYTQVQNKTRFFIDSMHVASGQSDESNYAKYNCVIWSGATGENNLSAWSYPPLKKWWTDISKGDIKVDTSTGNTNLFLPGQTSEIVTTSQIFDKNNEWTIKGSSNNDGVRIDGWVGPLQEVNRSESSSPADDHINGLEGLVTTNEYHTNGPRRWMSGMNGKDHGVGKDTRTYSSTKEENKHFMHLSFFAPGKDLHDNTWHLTNPILYGEDSWMDNLQGIWGGGVFTGRLANSKFGTGGTKHYHFAMEGNYTDGTDKDHKVNATPAAPGIGYGYDLKYKELHERQWDPTFTSAGDPDNKIRDFIRNLKPGAKFRFNHTAPGSAPGTTAELDNEVYVVKKIQLKKLYNHTSWRNAYNIYGDNAASMSFSGYKPSELGGEVGTARLRSVEQEALRYLNSQVNDSGDDTNISNTAGTSYGNTNEENLKKKIVDFGSAHNRRICFIIELDKNPATWGVDNNTTMGNPLDSNTNGADNMCADLDNDNFTHVEFLDPVQDMLLSDLNKFPAIWESSPKKQDVDLDIYYEASNNIPIVINNTTNELFAPKGCLVEMINPPVNQSSDQVHLVEWDNNVATFEPGLNKDDGTNEIDYSNIEFKFIRQDGSYTIAETGQQQLTGTTGGLKTKFIFKQKINDNDIKVGLSWYNCFSFGNGLESNRVLDDFNKMFITNGVKASSTIQETYEEENRKHGLIFSGLYNSNSGVNDLNQFIQAEKITKDLNPTYGSIQKLFSRDTDLVVFCEDKVLKVLANKDAVFNADGNPQLTANQNVLGQTVPFVGEYGISKNPESFCSESYRAYFADKQRGAVLRLSKDGLTPISRSGMQDWFRDNLFLYTSLIGTYDNYKEDYNLTLCNTYTENIIFNTFFQLGAQSQAIDASVLSAINDGGIANGSSFSSSWENKNILTNSVYQPNTPPDMFFRDDVTVVNHPYIPKGWYQPEQTASGAAPTAIVAIEYTENVGGVDFGHAAYATCNGSSTWTGNGAGEQLSDDGWYYDPDFNDYQTGATAYVPAGSNTSGDIFRGGLEHPDNIWNDTDGNKHSAVRRQQHGHLINEHSSDNGPHRELAGQNAGFLHNLPNGLHRFSGNYNPEIEKECDSYTGSNYGQVTSGSEMKKISQCITRDMNTKDIVFDRVWPDGNQSFVEFRNIGHPQDALINGVYDSSHLVGEFLDNYESVAGDNVDHNHNTMFNGDELHVQVRLRCYPTLGPANGSNNWTNKDKKGYNIIKPVIEIVDQATGNVVASDKLVTMTWDTAQYNNTSTNPYTHLRSTPSGNSNTADCGNDFAHEDSSPTYIGGGSHSEIKVVKPGFQSSGTVEFPPTSDYAGLWYPAVTNGPWNTQEVTVTVGCSFKFRDPTQQDSTGAYTGVSLDSDGNVVAGVEETAVVEKLAIRVYNNGIDGISAGVSSYPWSPSGSSTANNDPLSHPFWAITDMHVKKGFGIWEPHEDFVAGTPTTFYDDPETQAIEALTVAQITAAGGALDTDPNSPTYNSYILNQSVIDIWNAQNPGGVTYAMPAIPDADVDAFVEVQHTNRNWQTGIGSTVSGLMTNGGSQFYESNTGAWFGNNRSANLQSAYKTDPYTGIVSTDAADEVVWYTKGADPAGQAPQEDPMFTSGTYNEVFNGITVTSPLFDKIIVDAEGNSYNPPGVPSAGAQLSNGSIPSSQTHNQISSDYFRIQTAHNPVISGAYGIQYDHTTHYQQDHWYMVDVELNEIEHPEVLPYNSGTVPTIASGGADGSLAVTDAADTAYSNGQALSFIGGVGIVANADLLLQWHWRTSYINQPSFAPRWVLRAVFKATANTGIISNGNTDFTNIRFYNMQNAPVYVAKVIVRDVSYTSNLGTATSWIRGINDGNGDRHAEINTMTSPKIYFHNNKLCWDNVVRQNNYPWYPGQNFEDIWTQDLSSNPILNVGDGWILKFKVSSNSKTGVFNDGIRVRVSGDSTDWLNTGTGTGSDYTGIDINNIEDIGDYEVYFTMNGDATSWEIYNRTMHPTDPYTTAVMQDLGSGGYGSISSFENTITFWGNNSTIPTSAGVSNIVLTQTETIFSGGQAGSWDFDGFDSTTTQFIMWDNLWSSSGIPDGRIQFSNAPTFDSSFANGNTVISANQYIDKVINRYEQYEISFIFKMEDNDNGAFSDGQGLFHMYYFNSSGHGFRINRIGDDAFSSDIVMNTDISKNWKSPDNVTPIYDTDGTTFLYWQFTKVVGIGDGSSNRFDSSGVLIPGTEDYAYSEFENIGVEALRDTLVIRRDDKDSNPLTCWIDNISMRRVYPIESEGANEEQTLTYSEDVNGWTSFKSFVPESGVSLSKKYFTFKDAYLYQHYLPMKLNDSDIWEDSTLEEADNYNHFYDHTDSPYNVSSITTVMNSEPSIIKTFKTLNYEGTQALVIQPSSPQHITTHNAAAYQAGANIDGWYCLNIETDLDSGNLAEFIKKEGKWFGYIKGQKHPKYTNLDTSRFSVQGLGTVSNITIITN